LVLGVSAGHSAEHILAELLPHAAAVVLTRSQHPRALEPARLAELAQELLAPGAVPALAPDVPEALELARALARPGGLIVVTGSLFVVAGAREALGIVHERD
jgi:dihydrofolate synthase/folylpolyglutamate synthase